MTTPAVPEIRPSAPPSSGPTSLVMTQFSLHDAAESRTPAIADSAIRVDVGLLDKLMTLVGELVLARNQIMQFSTSQEDAPFLGTVQRLNLLTTELQASVMKTRMQPIGNVWSKFPRVVRDLAVGLRQAGAPRHGGPGNRARQDHHRGHPRSADAPGAQRHRSRHRAARRAAARAASPPKGACRCAPSTRAGKVIIEIADDGAGIDPQRIRDKAIQAKLVTAEQAARMSERELVNLVFLPGFSTAEKSRSSPAGASAWTWCGPTSRRSAARSTSRAGSAGAPRSG